MAVEYRPQPPVGGMGYDQNRYPHPQFTNPWQASVSASPSNPLYQAHYQHSPTSMEHSKAQQVSMGYAGNPAASSLGSGKCEAQRCVTPPSAWLTFRLQISSQPDHTARATALLPHQTQRTPQPLEPIAARLSTFQLRTLTRTADQLSAATPTRK